jgi:hypothetical protein
MSNIRKSTGKKDSESKNTRPRMMQKRNLNLRNELWPEINEEKLWNRQKTNGFITIPRYMTYIIRIIDSLSKGKPLGSTYLTLWCHIFDDSFLVIDNPKSMAFESGFQGQRAEDTWRKRMKKLQELGFIDAKDGSAGPFTNVLVYHPHVIIKNIKDKGGEIREDLYNSLIARMVHIGAKEVDTDDSSP